MDMDDLRDLVIIGYTALKWYTEYEDRKQKKRPKAKRSKRKAKRRSRK